MRTRQHMALLGKKYNTAPSSWFGARTFNHWFLEVFLPHVADQEEIKVLIGDNLGFYFSTEEVTAAIANNIYFTALGPNSTHVTQPLHVDIFQPLKVK